MPPKLNKESSTERLQLVAPASWVQRVNDWRRKQPDLPNVSEAIRRLVEIGLDTDKKGGKRKAE